ncbi:hypothetical protein HC251_03655 [Iamia sp. SCSIO 61187]|uniref:hypothetical protein n=1 Tax=Iamia sp. SCSIO 61187 TaxID=2722752 RepID=UPI001C62F8C3|nr:hypothetical protein [Iamia sp. SCSIO 61187]QYG91623.1 hypothetical protein HC251_03655 [Iamia sp. SCSIO 61187]
MMAEVRLTPSAFLRRRLDGTHPVDEWGLDPDVIGLVSPLLGVRWSVETRWSERIPREGPAVLVHNRALGLSEPVVLARGVRQATGRHVRTAGLVDVAPIVTVGRVLGAVVDRPAELRSVLRAGHLVALPLDRDVRPRRAGRLAPAALAPALATGAPVVPVALVGREVGRRWRLLVGEPIAHPPGRGPLAVADLVGAARAGVQDLLDSASTRWG